VRISEQIGVPSSSGPVRLYLTLETGDELEMPVAQDAVAALKRVLASVAQFVHEACDRLSSSARP